MLEIKAPEVWSLGAQVAADIVRYDITHHKLDAMNARLSIAWLHRLLDEVERELDEKEQQLLANNPHMWPVLATNERNNEQTNHV